MSVFPTTRWTLILAAQADVAAREPAWRELLATYWLPLYVFARREGASKEAAEDAVQAFALHLLQGQALSTLSPERGRLRAFLRTAFRNFMHGMHTHDAAKKRGAGLSPLSLDVAVAETFAANNDSPDDAFDRSFAATLVQRGVAALLQDYADRPHVTPVLREFFGSQEAPAYGDAARIHGMTVPELKSLLFRARKRFRELLLAEAREVVEGSLDAKAELQSLLALLGA